MFQNLSGTFEEYIKKHPIQSEIERTCALLFVEEGRGKCVSWHWHTRSGVILDPDLIPPVSFSNSLLYLNAFG